MRLACSRRLSPCPATATGRRCATSWNCGTSKLLEHEFGAFEGNEDVWYRCSPFYKVRDATTPTFVLHGEGREDWPETSRDFAVEMKRRYKTAEYKVYPEDGFYVGTLPNVRQMLSDVADFLDRYLRG